MTSVPLLDPSIESGVNQRGRWMVLIFDNDTNSQEEVVEVLMRATGCDVTEACIEMWEAHTYGKASVHFSSRTDCDQAARIISEIGVRTEVCPEWDD